MKYTLADWEKQYEEFRKETIVLNDIDEMMRPYTKKLWESVSIGDGVTVCLYTDREAYTVVNRTARQLILRRCKVKRAESFKPEWIPGGFGAICTNNHDQEWEYEEDENGSIVRARWSEKKCGFYVQGCMRCSIGRHEFYDYNW